MAKILVTGATGFAGSHLLDLLLSGSDELFGTYLTDKKEEYKSVNQIKLDLSNKDEVERVIDEIKPDVVYHLAALASAAESFNNPSFTINNNVSSQINLLEALKKAELKDTRILVISSGEVYGYVARENLPIDEETPFNPTNPYAVSKLTQDFLGLQYYLAYNLKVVRARPFNHVGARQAPNFVVSSFAQKIVEIEKGKRDPLMVVGNLEAKRDFTDVRDMVRAYKLLIDKGEVGDVYNIGSGVSYKISDILDRLLKLSPKGDEIKVEVDPKLFRPLDNPDLVCDYSKLKKITGWEPTIEIDDTLKYTLDYWRDLI